MKTCIKCKLVKNLSEFYPHPTTRDRHQQKCKTCVKEILRQIRFTQKYKDSRSAYQSKYLKTPGGRRANKRRLLKFHFGITLEQYEEMLTKQMGLCAICCDKMIEPHVDHDHVTHQVRGLLCQKCNLGIGQLNDNIHILKSAIEYLSKKSDLTELRTPITDNFV